MEGAAARRANTRRREQRPAICGPDCSTLWLATCHGCSSVWCGAGAARASELSPCVQAAASSAQHTTTATGSLSGVRRRRPLPAPPLPSRRSAGGAAAPSRASEIALIPRALMSAAGDHLLPGDGEGDGDDPDNPNSYPYYECDLLPTPMPHLPTHRAKKKTRQSGHFWPTSSLSDC